MIVSHSIGQIRKAVKEWRGKAEAIALVATMGNLHTGHAELIKKAQDSADRVIVSIFVNQLQFDCEEDYTLYAHTVEQDLALLRDHRVDMAFVPDAETMYPTSGDDSIAINPGALGQQFCGKYRSGHFLGVATVVVKLLNICQPDKGFFGEKDYQQIVLIRRIVERLDIDVEIVGVPTVRESDGLAYSSRNVRLTVEQREQAPELYRALVDLSTRVRAGDADFSNLENVCQKRLEKSGWRPEYITICCRNDLTRAAQLTRQNEDLIALAAAWLGEVRLTDNILI